VAVTSSLVANLVDWIEPETRFKFQQAAPPETAQGCKGGNFGGGIRTKDPGSCEPRKLRSGSSGILLRCSLPSLNHSEESTPGQRRRREGGNRDKRGVIVVRCRATEAAAVRILDTEESERTLHPTEGSVPSQCPRLTPAHSKQPLASTPPAVIA